MSAGAVLDVTADHHGDAELGDAAAEGGQEREGHGGAGLGEIREPAPQGPGAEGARGRAQSGAGSSLDPLRQALHQGAARLREGKEGKEERGGARGARTPSAGSCALRPWRCRCR